MKVAKACGILLTLSTLTACSPYLYKDEMTNISSAVSSISAGWKTGQQAMAEDYQAIVVERASWNALPAIVSGPCVMNPDVVTPPPEPDRLVSAFQEEVQNNHLNRGGTSCTVDLIQHDLMQPGPLVNEETMRRIDETIGALSAYSAALLAVTNATDKDGLAKAATGFSSAAGQAADVAKKLGAEDEAVAVARAASSVTTDLIGPILDMLRYRVLKEYVLAIDPLMPTLSGELGDALGLIQGSRLPVLAQRVSLELVEYNAGSVTRSIVDNAALLSSLLGHAASYNDLAAARPGDLAEKLARTHHDLADALRAEKGQMAALVDAAKTVANDAGQIQKALSSQTTAGKSGK